MRYIILVLVLLMPLTAYAVPISSAISETPIGISPTLPTPSASLAPIAFTLDTLSGTIAEDAFLSTTTSGLTGSSFRWTITITPTPTDRTLDLVMFLGFGNGPTYDLDYIVNGTTKAPLRVDIADSANVRWNPTAGLGAGDTAVLFLQTNIVGFQMLDTSDRLVSFTDPLLVAFTGPGFVPVPEPSSLVLLTIVTLPIIRRQFFSRLRIDDINQ